MAKKKLNKARVAAGVGAGIAVAAAGAAAYFFSKPKNRKAATAWALRMKKEVVSELKKARDMNDKRYRQAVDAVAARYKKMKEVNGAELSQLAKELKGHWGRIQKEAKREAAAAAKSVGKAAKRRQ